MPHDEAKGWLGAGGKRAVVALFALACLGLPAAGTAAENRPAAADFPPAADFPRGPVPPEQSLRLLKNALPGSYVLLDVRQPEAYAEGHLPGAVNIPLEELEARLPELPPDKPLFLTCRTGRRASEAYALIREKRPEWIVAFIKACVRYDETGGPGYRLDPPEN